MIELISCGSFSFAKEQTRQNEDALLLPVPYEGGFIFAVADGVGSYSGAKEAAQTAISTLTKIKYPDILDPKFVLSSIKSQISEAMLSHADGARAATTLSYCFVDSEYLRVIHTGDTRVYVKSGNKLRLLTKDHTQHQELLDDGLYTKKELLSLPGKNMLTAAISKSLPIRYQFIEIPFNDLSDDNGVLTLIVMSDGAHHFWEHRPRFSEKTMNNTNAFAANMFKRIQRLEPTDDHTLIAVSFQKTINN